MIDKEELKTIGIAVGGTVLVIAVVVGLMRLFPSPTKATAEKTPITQGPDSDSANTSPWGPFPTESENVFKEHYSRVPVDKLRYAYVEENGQLYVVLHVYRSDGNYEGKLKLRKVK